MRVSLPADEEQKQDRGSRSGGTSFGRNRDSDRNDRSDKPLGEWRAGAPVPHDPEKASAFFQSVELSLHAYFPDPSEYDFIDFHFYLISAAPKHSGVGFTRQQNRDRDGGSGFREFRSSFQPADSGSSFSRGFRDRDERDGGRLSERGGGGNRPFKRFEPRGEVQRSAFGKKFDRDDRDREMKREPERGNDTRSFLFSGLIFTFINFGRLCCRRT